MVKDKSDQSTREAGQAVLFFILSFSEYLLSLYNMWHITKRLCTHQLGAFPFSVLSATKISAYTPQIRCAHLLPLAILILCFYLKDS